MRWSYTEYAWHTFQVKLLSRASAATLSVTFLRTIPLPSSQYFTAVMIKQWMEHKLAPVDQPELNRSAVLVRSAKKAVTAGLAGAVLTNPLDVIRNASALHPGVRHV